QADRLGRFPGHAHRTRSLRSRTLATRPSHRRPVMKRRTPPHALLLLLATLAAAHATPDATRRPAAPARAARVEVAVFAMGCFWCGETQFEQQPGVLTVISGFAGGREERPTYEQVSAGETGHYESVQVTFDPTKTTYA